MTWLTATILFVMSFTLDSRLLWDAAKAPVPVAWACFINVVLLPLSALVVARIQGSVDLAIGLIIACSVPCTMASASVWTRNAGGNDAVSLLVTLITNGFCFVIIPFWLAIGLGEDVHLDTLDLVRRLVLTALLPTIIGQLVRQLLLFRQIADRFKKELGTLALIGILMIVFRSALLNADYLTPGNSRLTILGLLMSVISCNFLHMGAMGIGWTGSKLMRFKQKDLIAVLFASSQKTLPIGVFVATLPDVVSNEHSTLAVFPIIAFHVSQLFVDTFIASHLRSKNNSG